MDDFHEIYMVFPWLFPGFSHGFPCAGEVSQEWRELRLAKQTEASLPGASEGTGQSVVKAGSLAISLSLIYFLLEYLYILVVSVSIYLYIYNYIYISISIYII